MLKPLKVAAGRQVRQQQNGAVYVDLRSLTASGLARLRTLTFGICPYSRAAQNQGTAPADKLALAGMNWPRAQVRGQYYAGWVDGLVYSAAWLHLQDPKIITPLHQVFPIMLVRADDMPAAAVTIEKICAMQNAPGLVGRVATSGTSWQYTDGRQITDNAAARRILELVAAHKTHVAHVQVGTEVLKALKGVAIRVESEDYHYHRFLVGPVLVQAWATGRSDDMIRIGKPGRDQFKECFSPGLTDEQQVLYRQLRADGFEPKPARASARMLYSS